MNYLLLVGAFLYANFSFLEFPFRDMTMEEVLVYFDKNHIDGNTYNQLDINNIEYQEEEGDPETEEFNLYFHAELAKAKPVDIVKGDVFYSNESGEVRHVYLLSRFASDEEVIYTVCEFLVSYDKEGNYVDSKVIAAKGSTEITSELEGMDIHVNFTAGGETWTESYTIQPDLHLPKTYPLE